MNLETIVEALCESREETDLGMLRQVIEDTIGSLEDIQGKYILLSRSVIQETR